MATSSDLPLLSQMACASLAGASAGLISNPMDVVKTRFQLQGELGKGAVLYRGMFHCMRTMVKAEGISSLQKGLSSALCYQVVMNGCRLGAYPSAKQKMQSYSHALEASGKYDTVANGLAGVCVGGLGAFLGAPLFLTKVRLHTLNKEATSSSHSAAGPVGHQHKMRGVSDGLKLALREGGVRGLWRGSSAQVIRVMMGSGVQLSSYDWLKGSLRDMGVSDGAPLHFLSASLAGCCVAVGMNPADLVSARITNQPVDPITHRGMYYSGTLQCLKTVIKSEGILSLWKGVTQHAARIVPHTIATFLFLEQYYKLLSPQGEE